MNNCKKLAAGLPSKAELALLEFAKRVSEYYGNIPRDFDIEDKVFIVKFCSALIDRYNIDIDYTDARGDALPALDLIGRILGDEGKLIEFKVIADVEDAISQFEGSDGDSFGYAHLNSEEKEKIIAHLNNVQSMIDSSSLSDRKKNILIQKLSELLLEVNRIGTKTDAFFAFAGDLGFVLGDFAVKAKPLLTEIKDVLKIVTRSRARQEGVSLPPGGEVLHLTAPEL